MASYETLDQAAVCACRQGKLKRDLYSPNYPFGQASTGQATIACNKCSQYWEFDGQDNLRPKSHLKPIWIKQDELDALSTKVRFLQKAIDKKIEAALCCKFIELNATTKAAQHRLLQRSNLYAGSYRQYLRDGLQPVLSKIDTKSIVECEALVQELDSVKYELQELQAQHQLWYLENKHRLFHKSEWRLFA